MSWKEYDLAHRVAKSLGRGVTVQGRYLNTPSVLAGLAQMDVVIGVKLHSVILAHCADVPAIMLPYHPKCVSYMDSMAMGRYVVRGEFVSAGLVLEQIDELIAARNEVISTIRERKRFFQVERASFEEKVIRFLGSITVY